MLHSARMIPGKKWMTTPIDIIEPVTKRKKMLNHSKHDIPRIRYIRCEGI